MANEFQQNPQQGYQPQPGFQPGMPQGAGTPPLQFQEALQRWLANLTNFNGRARRSEYWWAMLAIGVAGMILNFIFNLILINRMWVLNINNSYKSFANHITIKIFF